MNRYSFRKQGKMMQWITRMIIALSVISISFSSCSGTGTTGANDQSGTPGANEQGNITTNTDWTAAQSPILLLQSIVVMKGVTLTIDPGVEVELNPDVSLYVDGTLNATGTSGSHIVFISAGTLGGGLIEFTPTSTNDVMQYVEMDNEYIGLMGGGVMINHVKIASDSYQTVTGGIEVEAGAFTASLGNLSIVSSDPGSSDLGIYDVDGSANLTFSNLLLSGYQYGVYAASGATVSLTNSTIKAATYDASVWGSSTVSLSNSDLLTTGQYAYYNGSSSNQSATGCYWGTTSSTAIQALIFDSHQSSSSGTVNYSGYLSSPVNATGAGW